MLLTRWNPTRDLLNVEREFNRLFNSLSGTFGNKVNDNEEYENAVWSPLTDISENKDNFILKIDLPGMTKNDVKISFANGQLTISGERKDERIENDTQYHRIERVYGKYFRSFTLPKEVKADNISAEFVNGQLTITVPKAEEIKPKEIEVKVK